MLGHRFVSYDTVTHFYYREVIVESVGGTHGKSLHIFQSLNNRLALLRPYKNEYVPDVRNGIEHLFYQDLAHEAGATGHQYISSFVELSHGGSGLHSCQKMCIGSTGSIHDYLLS